MDQVLERTPLVALTADARHRRHGSRGESQLDPLSICEVVGARVFIAVARHRTLLERMTPSLRAKWSTTELGVLGDGNPVLTRDRAREDGAFMEPSGRNQWQPVANADASKTAETSQDRCHWLRPVAGEL